MANTFTVTGTHTHGGTYEKKYLSLVDLTEVLKYIQGQCDIGHNTLVIETTPNQ